MGHKRSREKRFELWGSWEIELYCNCKKVHKMTVTMGDIVDFECDRCSRHWDLGYLVTIDWLEPSKEAIESGIPDCQLLAVKIYTHENGLYPLEIHVMKRTERTPPVE